jgi:NAD(P)H-flavin reductase/ferredoxin
MANKHTVIVNGQTFTAGRGDILLDAALAAGLEMRHDCRAGQCGSCAVSVVGGQVYGGAGHDAGSVLACQCRIISDVEVAMEDTPPVSMACGVVAAVIPLSADIMEVRIEPHDPVEYLPGQYFKLRFRGFPNRCYSPTMPLDRPGNGRHMHFHIRRTEGGRVSPHLGTAIRKGHKVQMTGPFGTAYLRPDRDNRLVLVATGTGFAPIWSIVCDALTENPDREIFMVVGAQTIDALYMVRAITRLAQCPNVTIVPTTSQPQTVTRVVRQGRPTEHLPQLTPDDIVYICGAPPMVQAAREIANLAGAMCYADPFVAQNNDDEDFLSKALGWITGGAGASATPPPDARKQQPGRPVLVTIQGEKPPRRELAQNVRALP